MTLSDELTWRGFTNQMTFKSMAELDARTRSFYFGVDPSADSMQIGNLAAAMMVKVFIKHGWKPVLLVGGATGLIGDPDGKKQERDLKTTEQIDHNKAAIAAQYKQVFSGQEFTVVDNYDWFQGIGYLQFLREIGKHVPMRQMLSREFVQSRLGEGGSGISYAEFSYSLIQGYDFLHLYKTMDVTLQVCGADQWGNSIAGVDLVRRITGSEVHVYSVPLIVNKTTGIKFGKSEAGAIWLDAAKTSITEFYQFWINLGDDGLEEYLKVYTELDRDAIDEIMRQHHADVRLRFGQQRLAEEVTRLVHGPAAVMLAAAITNFLTGEKHVGEADNAELSELKRQVKTAALAASNLSTIDALVISGLAVSRSEAARLLTGGAIYINGQKTSTEMLAENDFKNNKLLLRRGKAYKDSALIERTT